MRKASILTLLFGMLFSLNVWADKPLAPEVIDGATNLTAEQVVDLILDTPQLVIIDARKEEEYAKGHIEGAISILDTTMTEEKLSTVAPDTHGPLLFYCNGERCMRSTKAATKAIGWGYDKVYWFRGGWAEWESKGLPVSKQ